MTRARKGDKQAWDTLVERYAPLIWSICRRHQVSSADADDIGQRVWLQLVTRLDEVRDPAALPGWLATTTQRECGSIRRTVRRSQTLGRALAAEQIPGQQAGMAEQELLAAERHAALREALTRLPPCCQLLIAALIEDPPVPYAQISARLSIPAGSIGPSRSRCLEKLRRDPAIAALINAEDAPGEGGPSSERPAACCPPLCRAGRLPDHGQERLALFHDVGGELGRGAGADVASAGFTRPFRAVTLRSGRWRSYDGVGSHDSDTYQGSELHPIGLMGRRAGRGSVNTHKASVNIPSSPSHTLERVMTPLNAWKFNTLQGAGAALAKLAELHRDFLINLHDKAVVSWEAGRKKPKTVILPAWRFCEGACEHALRQ